MAQPFMAQPVATKESIKKKPSSKHIQHPNWQGSWIAGYTYVKAYKHFTLNNEPILYEASCIFTFTGTDPTKNGIAVTDKEKVTLTAKQTTLNGPVLRNEDTITGQKGNQLTVKSSHHLTTDLRT